ncbi:hypothetical protein HAHE_25220 [Haloferula helveola]|uniref:Secreted protein n=1 Tax=Haloferula helveola TaxID=490095 RepID=A0ABM7RFU3_9BACT|nr:hypothetical protein HAHE_25220 [Haloferula helveola]
MLLRYLLAIPAVSIGFASAQTADDGPSTTGEPDVAVTEISDVPLFTPPVEVPRIAPREFRIIRDRRNLSGGRAVDATVVGDPGIPKPPEPPPSAPLTEEQLAEFASYHQTYKFLSIGATVYNGELSRFSWSYEGQHYVGWSNIDFCLLQGLGDIEKGETTYSMFLIAGRINDPPPESGLTLEIPEHPELPSDEVAFVVTQGDPANDDALQGIVALHEIYVTRKDELVIAHEKNLENARQAKAWRDANPPQPKDIKVNFWRR